jgi:starch phosphorylase
MNLFETKYKHTYHYNPAYSKRVAYFSMEFAVDQSLKTYSGGLGFLAGSHMKSAYVTATEPDRHRHLMEIWVL